MSFTVYSNVEIPKARQAGRTSKYPLGQMEVGQSFFVTPDDDETVEKAVSRVGGSTQRFRLKNKDHKFSVRATVHPENGQAAVGVWRVA